MIAHTDFPETPAGRAHRWRALRQGQIRWAGNHTLHIYGTLTCRSGRRMRRENRVFFASEEEALALGYRPCGHCLRAAYRRWKAQAEKVRASAEG
ncbi:Metal binding domain of Ada [Catalinimonas alkaloidigena]|uniref:Metal binding domain of Ada n=1 Tax=Catalinimonas alkaloidigena TaxID=1075417 RepID=A0A1G9SJ70_9BACT|nr:Ada metal-binding domain-containing protein [Catalinimonas alkaloidigena]SDM35452.1 Metal binding domain of Ada [Catalinimonas alkaloidigena]